MDWSIYMIRCADGSLYTGITTDVERRLTEHQSAGQKGAKYLRGKGPLILEWQEKIGDKSCALKLERRIKKLPKATKEKLATNNRKLCEVIDDLSSYSKIATL